MQLSILQFTIFIIVLILLELLTKDTNIIVICWTILWSIWVYVNNYYQYAAYVTIVENDSKDSCKNNDAQKQQPTKAA